MSTYSEVRNFNPKVEYMKDQKANKRDLATVPKVGEVWLRKQLQMTERHLSPQERH